MESKIRNLFIKFLIYNNAYEEFIHECFRQTRHHRLLKEKLYKQPVDIINYMFSWSNTLNGWLYWANVSYQWKKMCLHCHIVKSRDDINFFEITVPEWREIDLKNVKKN